MDEAIAARDCSQCHEWRTFPTLRNLTHTQSIDEMQPQEIAVAGRQSVDGSLDLLGRDLAINQLRGCEVAVRVRRKLNASRAHSHETSKDKPGAVSTGR
nr:hypothetical protein [Steroidobacter sp.]